MKRTTRILVMLLTLLLPLAPAALATEQDPGRSHQIRLNQTAVATNASSPRQPETPLEILEQVASLFNSDRGLAISDSAAIFLLCNRDDSLSDTDYQPDDLGNLGVGLKIRF